MADFLKAGETAELKLTVTSAGSTFEHVFVYSTDGVNPASQDFFGDAYKLQKVLEHILSNVVRANGGLV